MQPPGRAPIDDRLVRAIGIPMFAVLIAHGTGLFGPYGPGDGMYWGGLLWFVLLSALVWHGNRWLLFRQREHLGWLDHPGRKVVTLAAGTVFGTAPVTVVMLVGWYRVAGFSDVDWSTVRWVTLVNVICVVFVTHVYETVFLIRERQEDALRVERLEKANVEAQLTALQAQLDPHFLFNAMGTLAHLIANDAPAALAFNAHLARVYRYILAQRARPLVLLREELAFTQDYVALLRLRFGEDALRLHLEGVDGALDRRLLPPMSLQLLVENAVKHNELARTSPLELRACLVGGSLVVANARRPRPLDRPSAGVGLKNLAERYRLATGLSVEIRSTESTFTVVLPLLTLS